MANNNSWSSLETNLKDRALTNLKASLDESSYFYWRGADIFKKFHGFISTPKLGALLVSSGPNFTNEYTTPQFSDGTTNFVGVNFSQSQFSFNVCLYYVTEEEYRRFLNWFNPYEVNWLTFGSEEKWSYQCKVNKITASGKYSLGRINGEQNFLIELNMGFDIVGKPVAYSSALWEWKIDDTSDDGIKLVPDTSKDVSSSDEDFPIDLRTEIDLEKVFKDTTKETTVKEATAEGTTTEKTATEELPSYFDLNLSAEVEFNEKTHELFSVDLNRLTFDENTKDKLYIRYLSESGLLLYRYGDSQEKLLSLQSSVSSGSRIVSSIVCNKFNLPGKFTLDEVYPDVSYGDFSIIVKLEKDYKRISTYLSNTTIVARAITNVI